MKGERLATGKIVIRSRVKVDGATTIYLGAVRLHIRFTTEMSRPQMAAAIAGAVNRAPKASVRAWRRKRTVFFRSKVKQ